MTPKTRNEIVAVLRRQGRGDLADVVTGGQKLTYMRDSLAKLLKRAKGLSRSKFPVESAGGVKIVGLLKQIEKQIVMIEQSL